MPDGDGDGWADFMDAFPADANEYLDSDGDGIADGYDECPDFYGNSTEDVEDALISTVMVGQTRLKEPIGIQAIQLSGQIQMETDGDNPEGTNQIHVW